MEKLLAEINARKTKVKRIGSKAWNDVQGLKWLGGGGGGQIL